MDDPVYQAKYEEGAERFDVPGKVKQAIDARFQEGKAGYFVSAGAQRIGSERTTGGLEVGCEGYVQSYLTTRTSLLVFAGIEDAYLGGDAGIRLQAPTRVAPFVGLGTFHGFAWESVSAEDDFQDNDDDGAIDEFGEEKERFSGWISSIYPEVGVHAWLSADVRLSVQGRYLITTEGRDADDWWYGGSIAVFSR